MAYQAIYRKWRPLTFEDVVGQSHITNTLKTEILTNKIAHAYLFCGTRGTGKTTTAKILSRAINCESILPNGNPCNQCSSCKGILSNTIMDVIEIDAASNNGVDNIRELRDEIAYTPANVKYKVYIIDEVHMLSTGAFNALLKTLEEPPSHAIFILATTEPHKIPETIKSRCQRFDFRRISAYNIAGRIGEITRKDGILLSQDAIRLVAELGDGSMRDSLSILDLCSGIEGEISRADIENIAGVVSKASLLQIASALADCDTSTALVLINKTIALGRDTNNVLDELLECFREILIGKIVEKSEDILDKSAEDLSELKSISAKCSNEAILHVIRTLSDTVAICKYAQNPRVMFEAAIVKICSPSLDSTTEAFAVRIKNLEGSAAPLIKTSAPPPLQAEPQNTQFNEAIQVEKPVMDETAEEIKEPATEPEFETKSENEPQIATLETEAEPSGQLDYGAFLNKIKTQNTPLYSLMQNTSGEIKHETLYIIFENSMFRDMVKANSIFYDFLTKLANTTHIKLVTKDEQLNNTQQKDPFDDILALDGQLEQLTII